MLRLDAGCINRMESCKFIYIRYCVLFLFLIYFLFSLDWTDIQWTGIGDEVATALADPRVVKNFKTLE